MSGTSSAAATLPPVSRDSSALTAATSTSSPSPANPATSARACHQRRTLQTGAWIAQSVCHPVPHRQFVFTIPKMLRGIFRKRRHLLHLLFQTATDTLRDAFRTRLNLPHGRPGAVHTFGDYLLFHPHIRILAADGLFDKEGRFHCMPAADPGSMTELFRHRFLHALRDGKHLSARKTADLLSWKHSGFHIDSGGEAPAAPHDTDGRRRLAEPERSGDRQPARLPAG